MTEHTTRHSGRANRGQLDRADSRELRQLVRTAIRAAYESGRNASAMDRAHAAEDAVTEWILEHTDLSQPATPVAVPTQLAQPTPIRRTRQPDPDRVMVAVARTAAAIGAGHLPNRPSAEAIRRHLHIAPSTARQVRELVRSMGGRS